MHLSKRVSQSQKLQKYLSYETHFFSKCSNFNVDFKTAIKSSEKVFSFSDNCLWTGSGKFFLLLREYSSSVVNVLTEKMESKIAFEQPNMTFENYQLQNTPSHKKLS